MKLSLKTLSNLAILSSSVSAANLMQKNLVSFAVDPSSTLTTTDADGSTSLQYIWYVASSQPTAVAAAVTNTETTVNDLKSATVLSISNSDAVTALNTYTSNSATLAPKIESAVSSNTLLVAQTETNLLTTVDDQSVQTSAKSISTGTTRNWDEPITVVTTTNSAGELITSSIWWLPSTSTLAGDDATATAESGVSYYTSYSKVKSTYTTVENSMTKILTTTFSSELIKAASISSKLNSTVSVHKNETNDAVGNSEGSYNYGVGIAALAVLFL